MRAFLLEGEFFLGAALATSMTKLALRYAEVRRDVLRISLVWPDSFFTNTRTIFRSNPLAVGLQ